jgi:hypothetical protein
LSFGQGLIQEIAESQRQRILVADQDFQGKILGFESFLFLPDPPGGWSQVAGFDGLKFLDQERQFGLICLGKGEVALTLTQLMKTGTLLLVSHEKRHLNGLVRLQPLATRLYRSYCSKAASAKMSWSQSKASG